MSLRRGCKVCGGDAMRGTGLCPEHYEENQRRLQKERDESPLGLLEQVSDLEELKDWIKTHLKF